MSAYRQTRLERNHGSKAHFAQPGRIKQIDTVTIEAQAKPQTAHFKPSRDFLLCPNRLLLPVCQECNSFIAVTQSLYIIEIR
ncbi:hypothetical protein Brsp06_04882 [Brucella sp. NBRC 13694]|jgi:hypothetical protein|nr:hypothetical protein BG46_13675 [Brucella anthropi]KIU70402.1 hypothetical protein TR92_00935 [Brucella anthropi]MBA8862830.1 hypothetical protein [Brucella anthropi]PQZ63970.1 hypothetical protein CQ057_21800 [Ochrobactrum sp. MYb49]